MNDHTKDLFSEHSDNYALYRPLYPPELYEFIFQHIPGNDKALDCGTGNGQAAVALSEHFKEVHAIDISEKQISNAVIRPNIYYSVCNAEKTPFSNDMFDLVTSATALHWLRFAAYFKEVKRIGKNNALFASWGYSVFKTEKTFINQLIDKFYTETIHNYWDPERRHVDEEYKNIPFPFKKIQNPGFATVVRWDLKTLEGYLNTWSAVLHYIRKNNSNPVSELMLAIRSEISTTDILKITFPIFMLAGTIQK